jgi:acid-sensing ion channel, other
MEIKYTAAASLACDLKISSIILEKFPSMNISQDVVKLLDKIAPSVEETFSFCAFRGQQVNCDKIFKRILTEHGFCYAFNSEDFDEIFNNNISIDFDSYRGEKFFSPGLARASKTNFLDIVLAFKQSDLNNTCAKFGKGWKIGFHQPNEMPNPFIDEYFIPFNIKREMIIVGKITKWEDLAFSYDANQRGVYAPGERKLIFFKQYFKSLCDIENMADFVLRKCGCVKFSMPRFNETRVCSLKEFDCYIESIRGWPYTDDKHKTESPMP